MKKVPSALIAVFMAVSMIGCEKSVECPVTPADQSDLVIQCEHEDGSSFKHTFRGAVPFINRCENSVEWYTKKGGNRELIIEYRADGTQIKGGAHPCW